MVKAAVLFSAYEYQALQIRKTELQKTYKSAEKEASDLDRKLNNIEQYLQQEKTTAAKQDKSKPAR